MRRRGFFGALTGLIAAPVAIKAAEALPERPSMIALDSGAVQKTGTGLTNPLFSGDVGKYDGCEVMCSISYTPIYQNGKLVRYEPD